MKKYELKDCAKLGYWFAHVIAFNKVAWNLGVWKPKYLFHDIEKPFLMFFWKDADKVQEYHVLHASHHPQGKSFEEIDLIGMILDWECARLTKAFAPRTAREFYEYKYKGKSKFTEEQQAKIEQTLDKLGL